MASLTCILAMKTYEELGDAATKGFNEVHSELMQAWNPFNKNESS